VGTGFQLNGQILAFTMLTCVLAALVSGTAPAFFSLRRDVNESLKEGGRSGSSGAHSHRTRAMLVISEVALATVALSFAFSLFVLVFSRQPEVVERILARSDATGDDHGGVTETMSRVLTQVEQLAALREQGALTDKEFAAQKARLLQVDRDRPQPTRRAR